MMSPTSCIMEFRGDWNLVCAGRWWWWWSHQWWWWFNFCCMSLATDLGMWMISTRNPSEEIWGLSLQHLAWRWKAKLNIALYMDIIILQFCVRWRSSYLADYIEHISQYVAIYIDNIDVRCKSIYVANCMLYTIYSTSWLADWLTDSLIDSLACWLIHSALPWHKLDITIPNSCNGTYGKP